MGLEIWIIGLDGVIVFAHIELGTQHQADAVTHIYPGSKLVGSDLSLLRIVAAAIREANNSSRM
jgi:hypothetical protein